MRDHILVGDVAPISGRVAAADATPILCLATHVLANDARHPVMVADDAATPGMLPDGRLELGMGAGRLALDDAAGSAEALIWNIGRVC